MYQFLLRLIIGYTSVHKFYFLSEILRSVYPGLGVSPMSTVASLSLRIWDICWDWVNSFLGPFLVFSYNTKGQELCWCPTRRWQKQQRHIVMCSGPSGLWMWPKHPTQLLLFPHTRSQDGPMFAQDISLSPDYYRKRPMPAWHKNPTIIAYETFS
jgi:hypothetical protein